MKSIKLILAIWLATSAWAQTMPPKQQVNPPAAAHPSGARTQPLTASSATPQRTTAQPANIQAKPSAGFVKTGAAQESGRRHGRLQGARPRVSRSRTVAVARKSGHKGPRDPFVSPIVERSRDTANCTGSGRQCLVVGEISLHGVVRSPSGSIAVVMNGEHTYFLRENDPLADGSVVRITSDAITLRQRSSDVLGRTVTREVTKKLGVPAA